MRYGVYGAEVPTPCKSGRVMNAMDRVSDALLAVNELVKSEIIPMDSPWPVELRNLIAYLGNKLKEVENDA